MSTAAAFALLGGGGVAAVVVLVLAIRMAGMAAELAELRAERDLLELRLARLVADDDIEDAAFRREIENLRKELEHARKRYRERARPGDGISGLRLLSRRWPGNAGNGQP